MKITRCQFQRTVNGPFELGIYIEADSGRLAARHPPNHAGPNTMTPSSLPEIYREAAALVESYRVPCCVAIGIVNPDKSTNHTTAHILFEGLYRRDAMDFWDLDWDDCDYLTGYWWGDIIVDSNQEERVWALLFLAEAFEQGLL